MKKLRKRIFAAVLAALMMVTAMPATALYASAETETVSDNAIGQAGTEDTEETVDGDTEETEIDGAGETVDGGTEEPAQEPSAGPLEEDTARCICETLCTEDSINGDCPVCGAEGADLSACKGKEQGSAPETDTEDDNAGADTAACICEILCTQDSINGDCPVCGADDADLSACKGKEQGSAPEKDTEDDNAGTDTAECICKALCTEDSINGDCPVCGTEDADLSRCKGEKTKEQEKTGEKVITAWEWIDPEEYLTDGILALPGAGRENPAFVEDVTALLPEKIQAKVAAVNAAEDGEETEEDAEAAPETEDAEITLTGWKCASYPEDGAYEGTYTFTAFLPEGFVLAEDAAALEVEVELGGGEMLEGEVSAAYQEASWNGSEVTYTGKTENCTSVESSTEAVTWNAGWYVVSGTVTISEPITVTGAVNLILGDGCTLNAEKGIVVETGNSLTIYAQSENGGTLNATGTTDDSGNASAGIGGSTSSVDSGSITIHGGIINATGGVANNNFGNPNYGGAGIGGSTTSSGNGGNSGTIEIYGGTITANSGAGNLTGAGIGGGAGDNVGGAGSNITIYGGSVTAASTGTRLGGAGIGGGGGNKDGGTGENINIYGGTVNATGGNLGAGIGGGGSSAIDDSSHKSGDGAVTISGGTVTAIGGKYAAGIGGGGGYYSSYTWGGTTYGSGCTGGTGSVTITGGIVDAKGGAGNSSGDYAGAPIGNGGNTTATATVSKTNAIVFENGAGTVCGDVTLDGSYTVPGDYTLNIPASASLSGSGTLSGGGTFTTENLTADMISVPTNLYYDGKDRTEYLTTALSGELDKGITICGQTFTVSGWTLAVTKAADSDLTYTATYTNDSDNTKTVQKTITLLQSGTDLSEGKVQTYKGETPTKDFTAGDTITVKATPTPTGAAPDNSAMFAASLTAPGAGQMAVFVGDTQVSEPVDAVDGTYTMEVSAADVLLAAGGPKTGITLTAKFVGNGNMADGTGTATVNITAAARVEKDSTTSYVDKNGLNTVFAYNSGYEDATVTLLDDLTNTDYANRPKIDIRCTLNLNGHTLRSDLSSVPTLEVSANGNVTIAGSGEIVSNSDAALYVVGTAVLEGGIFRSGGTYHGAVEVLNSLSGNLSVTGENVVMENTGSGYGLLIYSLKSVKLSAGKYSGAAGAISVSTDAFTLSSLLNQEGTSRVAYYKDNTTLVTEGLDGQTLPSGTYTVKTCKHDYKYTHTNGTTSHSQTCLACGDIKTSENCSYVDGKCACGSTLSAALTGTEKLVYNGNPHTPGVTVTLDGTKLDASNYEVAYADNVDAGTDTATVTVTGKGSYSFEIKKTFSIEKAEQENFAVVAETRPYEKNGTFTLSTTGGGGDGAVLYRVPENNGVLMVNGGTATIIGAGTVTVTASKAESDNYKAATATGNITIKKASAPAITYPTTGSITYGQKLSDSALTGGSTEYGTFAWENGSIIPAVDSTGYTVVFTASEETKKNYETITGTTKKVSVKVEQAVPAVSITAAVSGSKDSRQAVLTVNAAKAGAGAFPTGTVIFIDCTGSTEVEIRTVTLNSSGTASYTWEGLSDQEYTIKAVYAGDSNYKEAKSREFTFDAAKQNQQDFALDAIGAKTYGDAAVSLKTTGGSGSGAVRYESSDEDVVRIEDGRAVITGAGTATITAIKEGDDNYNEASAVRNVTVAKKALTVSADSKTVVRGNPMPAFTYRAEGLVNGDTFTTAPSITAGAQNTDTLGKYDIVISGGTLRNSESYRITYVNGTLNIVERFYTVTVTDGTGGGEYAEGDTVTVTANERNGYTFTGWSSEDGAAFADSKAKTTTFTMPAKSVTVKANYTRNSSGGNNGGGSGGNGGNSGGSENNGGSGGNDEGQGSGGGGSTNPGNGNTTPQPSVTQPTDTNTNPGNETAPGTGTTPVNPGNGNTARPGTAPGSGTGTPAQGTKQPFIKGEDGKIGWDVIRAEEEQAQEGSTINVDMNGTTVVPGDIFDSIRGRDITVTFDMGGGILWSVNGKEVITDKAGDIDFSVKTETNAIPVDIVNNVTGERYSIQISLAHEGEFGFKAVLSIGLGKENAGYTASLYHYNQSIGELEFICADTVAEDGTVSLAFTHASDYVIAIDGEEESGNATDPAQPDTQDKDGTGEAESPQTGQAWRPWWFIMVGALVIIVGIGVFFAVKKGKDGDSGQ